MGLRGTIEGRWGAAGKGERVHTGARLRGWHPYFPSKQTTVLVLHRPSRIVHCRGVPQKVAMWKGGGGGGGWGGRRTGA